MRIITATNRNLLDMVKEGTFREILYYRLNVLPLTLPPLRQRPEDIEPLTEFFLKRYNHKFQKNVITSPEYLNGLKQYSWPGNIRELKNVIQRYVITDGNPLYNSIQIMPQSEYTQASSTAPRLLGMSSMTYKEFKNNFETEYFKELLESTNGNISKISQITKLHISGIYKKLEKLHINPRDYQH